MEIYGADFSGARDPRGGIYYALGRMSESSLTIEKVQPCDDRLDLFAAIVESDSAWALDFPFAVPGPAYKPLGLSNWQDLLTLACSLDRQEFRTHLSEALPDAFESKCQQHSVECRHTDAKSASYSPFKQYRPNMRAMIYGGFKQLGHLRRQGVSVYPFEDPTPTGSKVYEVYPANTWQKVGVRRTTEIERFVVAFNQSGSLSVRLRIGPDDVADLDAADAVVACVTLASAIHAFDLDTQWNNPSPCTTSEEWQVREKEGLIVRACP